MSEKKIVILIISIICFISLFYYLFSNANNEPNLSDDLFFGTFSFSDGGIVNHPADFIVSIDVPPSVDDDLKRIAIESGIDYESKCWLYSFEDNRMFKAKKENEIVYAYDNNDIVATVKIKYKQFLGLKYDVHYYINWKGEERELKRVLQAYIFP